MSIRCLRKKSQDLWELFKFFVLTWQDFNRNPDLHLLSNVSIFLNEYQHYNYADEFQSPKIASESGNITFLSHDCLVSFWSGKFVLFTFIFLGCRFRNGALGGAWLLKVKAYSCIIVAGNIGQWHGCSRIPLIVQELDSKVKNKLFVHCTTDPPTGPGGWPRSQRWKTHRI